MGDDEDCLPLLEAQQNQSREAAHHNVRVRTAEAQQDGDSALLSDWQDRVEADGRSRLRQAPQRHTNMRRQLVQMLWLLMEVLAFSRVATPVMRASVATRIFKKL